MTPSTVRSRRIRAAVYKRLLEVWRRDEAGTWTRFETRSGSIVLESIRCALDVDDVYRDELGG